MTHGVGGGTTANSATTLLPFIGIEMVASRTVLAGESRDDSLRRVFAEIAELTGYRPYLELGFSLFKMTRHGLAHRFWPNEVELPNGPKCTFSATFWIDHRTQRSVCIDEIGPYVESDHLVRATPNGDVIISISALHLVRDVSRYIEQFLTRLKSQTSLQRVVEENDLRIAAESTNRLARQLTPADTLALGI